MKLKIPSQRTFFIVILTGLIISSAFFYNFIYRRDIENSSVVLNAPIVSGQEKVTSPLPVRLKIPKLNIDAAVEYVGLTPDGAMDVPQVPMDVAWFDLGPHPGDIGSSVVAGHSGYKDNRPAVFDSLYKLKKGDEIYVEDATGTTISFIVRDIQDYNLNQNASDVFGSSDGKAHLNLITCTGVWDAIDKTHSKRLIVFADRET